MIKPKHKKESMQMIDKLVAKEMKRLNKPSLLERIKIWLRETKNKDKKDN